MHGSPTQRQLRDSRLTYPRQPPNSGGTSQIGNVLDLIPSVPSVGGTSPTCCAKRLKNPVASITTSLYW